MSSTKHPAIACTKGEFDNFLIHEEGSPNDDFGMIGLSDSVETVEEAEVIAKRIVHRHNTHDALVDQLEKDVARFKRIREKLSLWNGMYGTQRAEFILYVESCAGEANSVISQAGRTA